MARKEVTTLDELTDEIYGPVGTEKRDAMELQLQADMQMYFTAEVEKKQAELRKLYQYKAAASRNNDIYSLERIREKIDRLEKEIIAIKKEKLS